MAILVLAVFALAIALEMTGHVVFRGRLILYARRCLLIWGSLACELAELASFFGPVKGLTSPLVNCTLIARNGETTVKQQAQARRLSF